MSGADTAAVADAFDLAATLANDARHLLGSLAELRRTGGSSAPATIAALHRCEIVVADFIVGMDHAISAMPEDVKATIWLGGKQKVTIGHKTSKKLRGSK